MEEKQNYTLQEFVSDLTNFVGEPRMEHELVTYAEDKMGKLISDPAWLSHEDLPSGDRGYGRYSLYQDPADRFEVLALVWEPGQKTPLHDHDGTWGVEGVVDGRIKVKNYLRSGQGPDDSVRLRYAGGLTLGTQSTGQLLPPADCHVLECDGQKKAVTVHVYGKQLKHFLVFDKVEDDYYRTRLQGISYTSDLSSVVN